MAAIALDGPALNLPTAAAVDAAGHLYVADLCNNRVLGWQNEASLSSGAPADLVIGQPDFQSFAENDGTLPSDVGGLGPDSLKLSAHSFQNDGCFGTSASATGIGTDGAGNLYVADIRNNRVLEYNTPFTSCASLPCVGPAASLVFGQNGSFTANGCNDGNNPGDNNGVGPDSLCLPSGVAVDPAGNVYVSDLSNGRVLEYDNPLMTFNVNATRVFGQNGSFITRACGNDPQGLCLGGGVALDGSGNLFVC